MRTCRALAFSAQPRIMGPDLAAIASTHKEYLMSRSDRRGFLHAAAVASAAALSAGPAAARPTSATTSKSIKYRLGLVTYNIAAGWDLPTLLRICKSVGLAPVELRTTHKHGVEPALTKEQRKQVRQRFADAGVDIWGCGTVCEFHSPDDAVVKKNIATCKEFIQLVADIGGRGVKVRPNDLPKEVPVDKTLAQIGKALHECGRAAADANVEIWLEVHGRGTAHPPHIKSIMERCDHPKVGVTWNSNGTDVKNGSVAEYYEILRPWLRSCHINELHSGYPYKELFQLFRQSGYDRVTLAEIQGMPDMASAERLLRYYKALWTELARDPGTPG
jgi:sugar phosphate isomerase/epimerase